MGNGMFGSGYHCIINQQHPTKKKQPEQEVIYQNLCRKYILCT
jgi:hypothetical protein